MEGIDNLTKYIQANLGRFMGWYGNKVSEININGNKVVENIFEQLSSNIRFVNTAETINADENFDIKNFELCAEDCKIEIKNKKPAIDYKKLAAIIKHIKSLNFNQLNGIKNLEIEKEEEKATKFTFKDEDESTLVIYFVV